MPTPAQTARRLFAALARLAAEEAALVQADDLAPLAAVQHRLGALVARVAALPATALPPGALQPLLAQREATARLLQVRRAAVRVELDRLARAGRNLQCLAPAYGGRSAEGGLRFAASA